MEEHRPKKRLDRHAPVVSLPKGCHPPKALLLSHRAGLRWLAGLLVPPGTQVFKEIHKRLEGQFLASSVRHFRRSWRTSLDPVPNAIPQSVEPDRLRAGLDVMDRRLAAPVVEYLLVEVGQYLFAIGDPNQAILLEEVEWLSPNPRKAKGSVIAERLADVLTIHDEMVIYLQHPMAVPRREGAQGHIGAMEGSGAAVDGPCAQLYLVGEARLIGTGDARQVIANVARPRPAFSGIPLLDLVAVHQQVQGPGVGRILYDQDKIGARGIDRGVERDLPEG